MAPPLIEVANICSSLLIYRPREDERLSWPSWLISSGRFTHIVVACRLSAGQGQFAGQRPGPAFRQRNQPGVVLADFISISPIRIQFHFLSHQSLHVTSIVSPPIFADP